MGLLRDLSRSLTTIMVLALGHTSWYALGTALGRPLSAFETILLAYVFVLTLYWGGAACFAWLDAHALRLGLGDRKLYYKKSEQPFRTLAPSALFNHAVLV